MAETQKLESQGIAKLVEYLFKFVTSDMELRGIQAQNAPLAIGLQLSTVVDTAITVFDAAQSGQQKYSELVVIVESTSSAGRYTLDGSNPTTTRGIEIPAGGTVIQISGHLNIKNFKMIAAAAGSMPTALQGFI